MRGRLKLASLAGAAALIAAVVVLVVVVVPRTSSSYPPNAAASPPASANPATPPASANPASPSASASPALPGTGAYFGAWVAPTDYSQSYSQGNRVLAVNALQQQIGRRLNIVHIYLQQGAKFPTTSDLAFVSQGSTLLVSWALNGSSAIAAGADDGLIRQVAQEIRGIGAPVFLEWRWEMDLPGRRAEVGTPAEYIAAWKHIRDIFTAQDVTNVAWVWCPSSKGFANGTAGAYYPGDSEVDWICADVYPLSRPVLQSFSAAAQPFLDWASHHPKPVMIGEFGIYAAYPAQERAQWLSAAARTVLADRQIKALVYFDGPGQKPGQSCALTGAALQAFRAIADDRYFDPPSAPLASAS